MVKDTDDEHWVEVSRNRKYILWRCIETQEERASMTPQYRKLVLGYMKATGRSFFRETL